MIADMVTCYLLCRLNMKNVKEREAKLARLGQATEEKQQQNAKLLKVICCRAAIPYCMNDSAIMT